MYLLRFDDIKETKECEGQGLLPSVEAGTVMR